MIKYIISKKDGPTIGYLKKEKNLLNTLYNVC